MESITTYWNQALQIIEKEISSPVGFETWILPIIPYGIEGDAFILKIGNIFWKEMIETRHLPLIKNAVKQVTHKDYHIVLLTEEDTEKTDYNGNKKAQATQESDAACNLNPRYVFSSFVVGNSNRMAHAAALAVAEAPAKAYNPLFIYGNVGLGKTHLMHSIAHYILAQKPNTKVLYTSSETFTNELINSIKDDKNEEFRNKYRNIDVLLVDDIQFIAQKERTQEEFFHTFNTLHESNKQIIISSDRPPKEIKTLEERLRSRFEWGLIADIQPPDYETRIAILRKKADSENLTVPDEVMAHIAKSIVSNIRELEGSLTRIVAYATLTNQEITLSLAEKALKDIFSEKAMVQLTPEHIQDIVGSYYNVRVEDLIGSKKPKNIAYPRQIAMYLSRKLLDMSLPKIGEHFGGRDHTTVIHACTKIENELEKDTNLQKTILELEKRIKGQ